MNGNGEGNHKAASGVDALIARLREEGVAHGQEEAERIVGEARTEAKQILERAKTQARNERDQAHKDAAALRTGGEEALKTAMRDMVLRLKSELMQSFSDDLRRLVSRQLQDPEVLRRMILEVAGRSAKDARVDEEGGVDVLLPATVLDIDDLRNNPESLEQSPLTQFVFGLTKDMLQEGVSFVADEAGDAGIRVRLKERHVELDLSDKAVADMLLQHLQPRFRAILEGVVR